MLKVITFDFWNTLVDGQGTPERTAQRVAALQQAIVGAGGACTPEELELAFDRVAEQFDGSVADAVEEVGPPGRWAVLARELNIPEGLIPFEVVEKAYEDLTLNPPPEPMPHVQIAIQSVKQAGYRLGVICNTGMAGGRVLRQVLASQRMLDCFDVTVFSNEVGIPKPNRAIFERTLDALGGGIEPGQALHVGDREEIDVAGARNAAWHSALYAPFEAGEPTTEADLVVHDWRDFASQVANFVMPEPP